MSIGHGKMDSEVIALIHLKLFLIPVTLHTLVLFISCVN